jgi:hypothetical protein
MTMTTAPAEMPAEMPAARPHLAPTTRRALNALRPTLAEVAAAIAVTRDAIRSYHDGARRPPEPVRLRLAAYLRARANLLEAVAAELERGPDAGTG